MMRWLSWIRPDIAVPAARGASASSHPRPEETDRAAFQRWQRYWAQVAAERDAQRRVEEAAEAERARQRAERERQRVLAIAARQGGVVFPGDELDDPRQPAPEMWEDGSGIRWFKF